MQNFVSVFTRVTHEGGALRLGQQRRPKHMHTDFLDNVTLLVSAGKEKWQDYTSVQYNWPRINCNWQHLLRPKRAQWSIRPMTLMPEEACTLQHSFFLLLFYITRARQEWQVWEKAKKAGITSKTMNKVIGLPQVCFSWILGWVLLVSSWLPRSCLGGWRGLWLSSRVLSASTQWTRPH